MTTNASGIAAVTSWTLGPTAGTNNNTLTATSTGLTGSPVTFTASATAGSATQIALNAGDGQTATVNTAVAIAPSVIVRDAANNPVAGVSVTFAVGLGGGSITGANATTNASGIATVGSWTLGTTAGTNNNTLTATATGLTGSPVTFTASATAGPATQIALNAGDGQTATVNTAVAIDPSVIVRDAFNNPVQGRNVTFTVTAGGGSTVPASPAVVATNASGIAAVTSWTLGPTAGTNNNTLTATSTGLTGSPVAFTASATAGSATQMALNAGDGQTATVNTAVAIAPSVIVRDAANNPVAGVSVTFAVGLGGGSITGANATTNASGIATVGSWTLGPTAGTNNNTLTATATGLTGSPVTFTASATAGAATQIAINAGDGQVATAGTAVATPPSVIVQDAFDNPVAGVAVTFAVLSGGGTVDPTSPVMTNASGIAAVTSWTLGATPGTNELTATASGLSGSPVKFTAVGSP
jgi:adhesin/invasin